jgi:hypothetical protein
VEEFVKTYLKNKRSYARKKGYLTETTNQKQDTEEEEEKEEEEEGRGKGKGKGKEIDMGDSDVPDDDLNGSDQDMPV